MTMTGHKVKLGSILLLLVLSLHFNGSVAQQSISQVKGLPLGSVVTTTGTISSGSEFGQVRYMQDAEDGIATYSSSLSATDIGDSIVVNGVLSNYRGQLQISPVFSFERISSGHSVSSPVFLDLDSISTPHFESENIILTCAGVSSCEPYFQEGAYTLYDQWGNTARLWITADMEDRAIPISSMPYTIDGIWMRFEDQYQLMAQDIREAVESNCHYISPAEISFVGNAAVLSWQNLPFASTFLEIDEDPFGITIVYGMQGGDFEANTDFLPPGKLHKARLRQEPLSGDVFYSLPFYFQTPAAHRNIEILFNRSIDESFSDGSHPFGVGASVIEADLVDRIDDVTSTLDLALYNTTRAAIVSAVNRAVMRGVAVRYIADDETSNSALDGILSFPVYFRSGDGIMHNKFIIADADIPDKAWLWAGSTNLSTNQLSVDPNHAYIIHDQSIALNYRIEFDELWGTLSGYEDSRYGDFKTNNSAHLFNLDGLEIESYFSPSDETTCRLMDALQSADYHVQIGLLLLTHNELVDEIINTYQRGVDVRVIVEDEGSSATALSRLRNANVPVVTHHLSGIYHHKSAIIDEGYQDSNPLVVSGSHNWTWSADNINDENTLIFHDQSVANIFRQEFEARWKELNPSLIISESESPFNVLPNPATDFISITNPLSTPCDVMLFNMQGQIIDEFQVAESSVTDKILQDITTGIYFLQFQWNKNLVTIRLVLL